MIHVVIGTRAQLIKMAPIMYKLQEQGIDYNFIFMAQHHETIYEMIDQFGLKRPDYVVGDIGTDIVRTPQMFLWSIGVLWHSLWNRKKMYKGDNNGIVLIHGDAPPLLLGGITAKMQGLKVASVEAGLRSYNLFRPFPEEITRVIAAKFGIIDVFFGQDEKAYENSLAYNRKNAEVYNTNGNTMIDAIELATKDTAVPDVDDMPEGKYALATIHRFETITKDEEVYKLVERLERISKKMPLLFIMHPPTREVLEKLDLVDRLGAAPGIYLSKRLDFFSFNKIFGGAEFIVTDGGSNQEESAYMGIPCLVYRTETERFEGLGKNVVISELDDQIIDDFVNNYEKYKIKTEIEGIKPTDFILDKISKYK